MPRFILFFLAIFLSAANLAGASVTVAPIIIDLKGKPRDILPESVTLVNNANYKVQIYPTVNNLSAREGRQEFSGPAQSDLSASLANWIAISRGVIELLPGEKRNIEFSININLRAEPGIYHAVIAFPEGPARSEAEAKISQAPSAAVNLEVLADSRGQALRLKKFSPEKTFFSGFPASLFYILENQSGQIIVPDGEIIIYNRRGEETAVLAVNESGAALAPDALAQLSSLWAGSGEFGRYKAYLRLEYGQGEAIQDTIFFWVLPWKAIVLIFGLLSTAIIASAHYWHRHYEKNIQK